MPIQKLINDCATGNLQGLMSFFSNQELNVNQLFARRNLLKIAAKHNHVNIIIYLVACSYPEASPKLLHESFCIACKYGSLEVVKHFPEMVNINQTHLKYGTALHAAIGAKQKTVVDYLLRRPEINPNISLEPYFFPLFYACSIKSKAMVKQLLTHPQLEVNQCTNGQTTAFMYACILGHTDIVGLLLADPRTNIQLEDIDGCSPFYIACINARHEILYNIICRLVNEKSPQECLLEIQACSNIPELKDNREVQVELLRCPL